MRGLNDAPVGEECVWVFEGGVGSGVWVVGRVGGEEAGRGLESLPPTPTHVRERQVEEIPDAEPRRPSHVTSTMETAPHLTHHPKPNQVITIIIRMLIIIQVSTLLNGSKLHLLLKQ